MRMRVVFTVILATVAIIATAGDYASLESRARMFYNQRIWPSALAMYQLMLDERPSETDVYGRAIAVAGMDGNSAEQLSLMKKAIDNHIPFDSIFNSIERNSFDLGDNTLYERFLVTLKESEPWLTRPIDTRLLDYYIYRRDGVMIVEYAKKMLHGAPDNIRFLHDLADGYMLTGDYQQAIRKLQRVLYLDPDNYRALLTIGNYYYNNEERDEARPYLEHAQRVQATPYVERMLQGL